MTTALEDWFADVDDFVGLTGAASRERAYREAGRERLAGRWVGCYLQPIAAFGPMWMDLELDLQGEGPLHTVHADGNDGLGRFTLAGSLDTSNDEALLLKQYVDSHGVQYRGLVAGRAIRGVWTLAGFDGIFALWNAETLDRADLERARRGVKSPGQFLVQTAAMLTVPFRVITLVRHARLVSRFGKLVATHA